MSHLLSSQESATTAAIEWGSILNGSKADHGYKFELVFRKMMMLSLL